MTTAIGEIELGKFPVVGDGSRAETAAIEVMARCPPPHCSRRYPGGDYHTEKRNGESVAVMPVATALIAERPLNYYCLLYLTSKLPTFSKEDPLVSNFLMQLTALMQL